MKYRTILLFGAPGAGKGTQGKILGTIPHFFHCACGDVFRNLRIDNELGRIFIEYSSRGELVPDDATIRLWTKSIAGSQSLGHFAPDELRIQPLPLRDAPHLGRDFALAGAVHLCDVSRH